MVTRMVVGTVDSSGVRKKSRRGFFFVLHVQVGGACRLLRCGRAPRGLAMALIVLRYAVHHVYWWNMLRLSRAKYSFVPLFGAGAAALSGLHDGPHHKPRDAAAVQVVERPGHEGGADRDQDSAGDVGPA